MRQEVKTTKWRRGGTMKQDENLYGWLIDLLKEKDKQDKDFQQIELELPVVIEQMPAEIKEDEAEKDRGVVIIET